MICQVYYRYVGKVTVGLQIQIHAHVVTFGSIFLQMNESPFIVVIKSVEDTFKLKDIQTTPGRQQQ